MAAIMRDEPPELSESGRNISSALDHIVKHCLEKDRDNRFQSARDIAFNLSEQSSPTVASGAQLAAPPTEKRKILIAVAAIVVLAVAGVFLLRRTHPGVSSAWLYSRSRIWDRPRTTTSPTASRMRYGES
jgi:serine/threonine protein kinase